MQDRVMKTFLKTKNEINGSSLKENNPKFRRKKKESRGGSAKFDEGRYIFTELSAGLFTCLLFHFIYFHPYFIAVLSF